MPKTSNFADLTDQQFGRLTVIRPGPPKMCKGHAHERQWYCQCSCGNPELVLATPNELQSGSVKSCGCLRRENSREMRRKHNEYCFKDDYVIGYTNNTGEPFAFDTSLFDLVSQYCWYSEHGYIQTSPSYKTQKVYLHRLITNAEEAKSVDHINHDTRDNRLCNLRVTTPGNNTRNRKPGTSNVSGVSGVRWNAANQTWDAQIGIDYKVIHLGCFKILSDAIAARKAAEEKYYGEFSYDYSMRIAPPVPPELFASSSISSSQTA